MLGWQNGRESFEDISVTVDAIDVDVDIGVVYRGLDEGSQHHLVSVVSVWNETFCLNLINSLKILCELMLPRFYTFIV